MGFKELVHPGMTLENTFVVGKQHLASHLGSGGVNVLATPYMIAFMEGASHSLLAQYLPEGYSSVGTHVDIRHLAPTPQGSAVRVKTEVVEVEGNLVKFNIQAWDEYEQIGSGLHERAVIEIARFQRRVTAKSKSG